MARKTLEVQWVIDKTNTYLEGSVTEMSGERFGMALILEAILLETGNYKGFRYLPSETNPNGELKDEYDASRRFYFGGSR